jgi:O-antigen/teichoic acid export membrane protein
MSFMVKEYKQLINGTAVNGLGLVFQMLSGFFIIPIQIFYLGLEAFGLIVISSMFAIQGFIAILDLGMPGALTQRVAMLNKGSSTAEVQTVYSASILVFFLIGLVLSVILLLCSSILGSFFVKELDEHRAMFTLGLQVIFLSYIWQFPLLILRAQMLGFAQFKTLQFVTVVVELLRFLAVISILKLGYGFQSVIFCNALFPILELLMFSFLCPTRFKLPSFRGGQQSLTQIWRMSKLLFFGRLSSAVLNNSDKVVASIVLSPSAVGFIDIFTKMPALLNRVFGLSVSSIIPVVAGFSWPADKDKVNNIYHVGFNIYFLVISLPILQLIYFTPEVLDLWVGQQDKGLIAAMQLMLLWTLLVPLQFGGNLLLALDRHVGALTRARIVMALLKVVSLIVLVSVVGYFAVPLSYLISSFTIVYLLFVFRVALGISLRRQLVGYVRVIFTAGVPVIGYHFSLGSLDATKLHVLLPSIALITAAQIVTCYFGAVSKNERDGLKVIMVSKLRAFIGSRTL